MRRLNAVAPGVFAAIGHAIIQALLAGRGAVNTSPSLPLGLYREMTSSRLTVGSFVLVCLPENIAQLAVARGYLARGRCPNGVEPLGKRVAAVGGDSVAVLPTGVVVDGKLFPGTSPLLSDNRGRALPQLAGYRHVLRAGEIWLVADRHPRSFDSRYFGPIHDSAVIATLVPLWTW